MTYSVIPLAAVPSQVVTVTLIDQRVRLSVRQRAFGVFVDIYVNDALILGGVLARNLTKLVRSAYLGFIGELYFFDTQGEDDPVFTGIGSRFVLIYESA